VVSHDFGRRAIALNGPASAIQRPDAVRSGADSRRAFVYVISNLRVSRAARRPRVHQPWGSLMRSYAGEDVVAMLSLARSRDKRFE
jgi:hypothetical protein